MAAHQFTFKAMGSPCSIRVPFSPVSQDFVAEKKALTPVVELAIAELGRLEAKYSRYLGTSFLTQMNASVCDTFKLKVDEETAAILNYADTAWYESDGLFDVTSGVLRKAWDFSSKTIPSQEQIDALLSCVGWQKVSWQKPHFRLPASGMELDFGGCVKEYAADAAATKLMSLGVSSALIDLGGDICVVGNDYGWPMAIRNPRAEGILKRLTLNSGALASSGDYERFIELNGRRYSHILNPLTGWPVRTPASVSVIGESCLVAGTVSTVAMLKGEAGCIEWLDSVGLPYLCVFDDGKCIDKL